MSAVLSPADAASAATRWRLIVVLFTLYIVWGSTYLAMKLALPGYSPYALATIRLVIAALLLGSWLLWRGARWPTARQWRHSAIVAFFLLVLGNGLVTLGMEYGVSSGVAAIAVASMPLFAALFAGVFGKWPHGRDWLGLAIGFIGVLLLNIGGDLSANPIAALMLILAPAGWAFGSVYGKRLDLPEPITASAAQMICGIPMMAAVTLFRGEPWIRPEVDWVSTSALIYLAVFGSVIGLSAYAYALHHTRPALATSYAYVNPPVAVVFGVLFAGEVFHALDLIGMTVILIGVALITLRRAPVRPPEADIS